MPAPLVRLHSECATGDIFGSQRCDCGAQLQETIGRMRVEGGLLLYLRQEGRGIGFAAKMKAYALQDMGLDTFQANRALGFEDDARDYQVAAQMLIAKGIHRVRLITNNPEKSRQLACCGVDVVACETTGLHINPNNRRYLAAKAKAGHSIKFRHSPTRSD